MVDGTHDQKNQTVTTTPQARGSTVLTPVHVTSNARTPLKRWAALALTASLLPHSPLSPQSAAADETEQRVTLEVISGGLRIDLTARQFPAAPSAVAFVRDHRGSDLTWGMTASFRPTGTHPLDRAAAHSWQPRCTLVNDSDDVITEHDLDSSWHQQGRAKDVAFCTSAHGDDGISTNVTALEPLPPVSGIVTVTVY